MNLIDPFQFRRLFASARSLAMVGNAPTILDYENGERIDSHDLVVRFNRATTAGNEAKIGSRTDILVVNASNSKKLAPPPSETTQPKCLVSFVSPQGIPNVDYDAFAEWVGDLPLLLAFGPDLIGVDSPTRTRPMTSGTYFLYMALRLLTLENLFVTGFTMFGAVAGGAGKYYSDTRPGIGTFHDLDAEEPVFADMLGSFGGNLETTTEVAALLRRNAVKGTAGDSAATRNGHRSTLGQRIAGALSWRLMGAAMRLRRISEKTR
jgi:Glycosyltransferase family 29 (sialyltransferase)